ncbi:uncharacterized protein B0T15DRAFT_504632 [Chaetomium strumarium]|uniref:Uncharacterized protein n=1 Tax=Chaetomium strumarium TaxID=1170767 RepID=A0AAJ0LZK8_9PEZI|nr:hypothetical protein B0T15DRAFT_504632 [Chaetomium strumarium]
MFRIQLNGRRTARAVVRGMKAWHFARHTVAEVVVVHSRVEETHADPKAGKNLYKTRTVRLYFSWGRPARNQVEVEDVRVVQDEKNGEFLDRRKTVKRRTPYTLREVSLDRDSKPYWTAPKYMLDEFVNRVRGRPGSGAWVTTADSMVLATMVDLAYKSYLKTATPRTVDFHVPGPVSPNSVENTVSSSSASARPGHRSGLSGQQNELQSHVTSRSRKQVQSVNWGPVAPPILSYRPVRTSRDKLKCTPVSLGPVSIGPSILRACDTLSARSLLSYRPVPTSRDSLKCTPVSSGSAGMGWPIFRGRDDFRPSDCLCSDGSTQSEECLRFRSGTSFRSGDYLRPSDYFQSGTIFQSGAVFQSDAVFQSGSSLRSASNPP